jgi:hypothetical protein
VDFVVRVQQTVPHLHASGLRFSDVLLQVCQLIDGQQTHDRRLDSGQQSAVLMDSLQLMIDSGMQMIRYLPD